MTARTLPKTAQVQPGSLTVICGSERVTLTPTMPESEFREASHKIERMLDRMTVDHVNRVHDGDDFEDATEVYGEHLGKEFI